MAIIKYGYMKLPLKDVPFEVQGPVGLWRLNSRLLTRFVVSLAIQFSQGLRAMFFHLCVMTPFRTELPFHRDYPSPPENIAILFHNHSKISCEAAKKVSVNLWGHHNMRSCIRVAALGTYYLRSCPGRLLPLSSLYKLSRPKCLSACSAKLSLPETDTT